MPPTPTSPQSSAVALTLGGKQDTLNEIVCYVLSLCLLHG